MTRPPLDPVAASIVRSQLSRRDVLRGAGAAGITALLAACGIGGATSTGSGPSPAADRSTTDKRVRWANWAIYLDYDEATKTNPTLRDFERKTGVRATYHEDIEGNDTYFGKIQGQLKNGQDIGRDLVVLTDWMAARLIRHGYVQELDRANIPNAANLTPKLRDVDFDPGRRFSLTWQSGFVGLAWNKEKVPDGLRRVSDLWRPELKGRVEVVDEMRDTIGLIMLDQGADPSQSFGEDAFMPAVEELEKHIRSGQIRQVKGGNYQEDLVSEDALAVIGWSGDITQINFESGDKWEFAIPEAGGMLFSDNLLVPVGSPYRGNAERLIDHYYDPAVAAQVAAYVNYICPVEGAREEIRRIDPELADNPLIFPDRETLAKTHVFRTLSPDEERTFSAAFQQALGN